MTPQKIFILIVLFSIVLLSCQNKDESTKPSNIENGKKITAAYKFSEIESLANPQNESNGLTLEAIISNDVDINGKCYEWIYSYTSAGIAVTYYYRATAESVALDSVSKVIKIPPIQLISHKWINSNDAVKIAENNGGEDFRNNNTNYKIEIKLEEPLVYNAPTYWYVTYYSKLNSTITLSFVIDATSGIIKL